MSDLACHVDDYLRLRRSLGFKLEWPGHLLHQLLVYLDTAGATTLTANLLIEWARLPQNVQPLHWAHRLGVARSFAMYLKTVEPATEVPPPPRDVFGARQVRPAPYLWSQSDIPRLLEACRDLRPALRAMTYEALFGLLAVSGMRRGEALALGRDDVDLENGVLIIREAKFGRSRLVPLHSSSNVFISCAMNSARMDRTMTQDSATRAEQTRPFTAACQLANKRKTVRALIRRRSPAGALPRVKASLFPRYSRKTSLERS